ncbi:MAG: DUF3696 domain-containing protein [Proteobacteria bacterium]|nr:DUF3696 domain-containing protein [Pseudomonadota bacterium]
MIRKLEINGFKKFSNQAFEMAPLTILAGMNGSGKTSVVHSLLLIREAIQRGDHLVQLNGPFSLELGTFEDIQNWSVPESVSFQLTEQDDSMYTWVFTGSQTALYAEVQASSQTPPSAFSARGRNFQYLSAERLGPRSTLSCAALPPELLEVGSRGEYSAQVLYTLGSNMVVNELRRCPGAADDDAPLLKFEAERWLSLIARPVQIDAEPPTAGVSSLRFRVPEGEWVRPPNMGFGVTYALPVVLAGLTAGKGGLLIVENPEAHLHPSGQSKMGHFLATIAADGVQVLVETHSDHVLNGIRRAIGEYRILPSSQATVHYFDVNGTPPQNLSFTETGGIDSWPSGFFDQYQLDIAALTRIRRSR